MIIFSVSLPSIFTITAVQFSRDLRRGYQIQQVACCCFLLIQAVESDCSGRSGVGCAELPFPHSPKQKQAANQNRTTSPVARSQTEQGSKKRGRAQELQGRAALAAAVAVAVAAMTGKRGLSGNVTDGPCRGAATDADNDGDADRRSTAELLAAREQVRVRVCGCTSSA
jgi:hypothetical protein